jgi:periplasmic divalent cation tolerance protein
MSEELVVLSTCGAMQEAETIARALVEGRLAACVNIVPAIRSIYRWQGAVEDATELLLLIKTDREHLETVIARVRELHSYELPEAIALPVVGGLPEYLGWVRSMLQSRSQS